MGFETKMMDVVSEVTGSTRNASFFNGTLCVVEVTDTESNAVLAALQENCRAKVLKSSIESRGYVEYLYDFA
jgi:hypothetical protein